MIEVSQNKYLITGSTFSHDGDISFNHDSLHSDTWTIMFSDFPLEITDNASIQKNQNVYVLAINDIVSININSQHQQQVNLVIYNIEGRVVLKNNFNINIGVNHFDLPIELNIGIYTLIILGSDIVLNKKFILN